MDSQREIRPTACTLPSQKLIRDGSGRSSSSHSQGESQSSGSRKISASGKWELDDNLRFVIFIDCHHTIFSSKYQRKSCKIFKSFSKYMGDRTAAQCRSHFQKLLIRFKTILKLIRHYKNIVGNEAYSNHLLTLSSQEALSNPTSKSVAMSMQSTKSYAEIGVQTDPGMTIPLSTQPTFCLVYPIPEQLNCSWGHPWNWMPSASNMDRNWQHDCWGIYR